MERKSLSEIFDQNMCDKGTWKHHYYRCYEPEFRRFRDEPIKILEIGTLKGASTLSWVQYFPNAEVYTIDTFERVPADSIRPLQHPRVKWLQCDSTDANSINIMRDAWGEDIKFDVIIDDGCHFHFAIRDTFVNMISLLAKGGSYYIEDVINMDHQHVLDDHYTKKNSSIERFSHEGWKAFKQAISKYPNITVFDYSNDPLIGHVDTYIIKITK